MTESRIPYISRFPRENPVRKALPVLRGRREKLAPKVSRVIPERREIPAKPVPKANKVPKVSKVPLARKDQLVHKALRTH